MGNTKVLAIKWLDEGPAKDTIDLIPRRWFDADAEGLFKQHRIIGKGGENYGNIRCNLAVRQAEVWIDYEGEHAEYNESRGFIIGCTRLTFSGPGRQGDITVWWRGKGEASFSNHWQVSLSDRQLRTNDMDRFRPKDPKEGQLELYRRVAIRQGKSTFRDQLMVAYRGHCAVTGCAVEEVLQAAHIEPYAVGRNNSVTNGILLRADIHSLFDLGIVRIRGDYAIDAPDGVRSAFSLPMKLAIIPESVAHQPCPHGLERKWQMVDEIPLNESL